MISCLSYIESIEGLDYNLKLIFCKKYRTKWYMCGGVCFFTYNLFVCGCKSCSCSLTFDRRWPTQEAEHAAVKFNLRTRPPVKPTTTQLPFVPNTPPQLPKTLSTLSQNQPIVPRIFNNQPSGFSSDFFLPRTRTSLKFYWRRWLNFDFFATGNPVEAVVEKSKDIPNHLGGLNTIKGPSLGISKQILTP